MIFPDFPKSFGPHVSAQATKGAAALASAIEFGDAGIKVTSPAALCVNIGALSEIAAFGTSDAALAAHRLAWQIASALGIFPASIEDLYRGMGRNDVTAMTVPAMNMRAVAFESARGVFQAMQTQNVGAAIFELSRGEIGFTGQRPREFTTAILCAAIAENHTGPLFLQGDHFQISASRYAKDPQAEVGAVKDLITEAVGAGFYNIDIDCSTLVDLSWPTEVEQQRLNIELTAELARHTRTLEPESVTISLGGEIGEVGDENSTVREVDAYLKGVTAMLGPDIAGLSKLSIQSGTRHGGNVLADGSFGDMNVDFALIGDLTGACRVNGRLAGCVQHGASMLSMEKIAQLPDADCIEVHLAAAFLNAVYAHLPQELVTQADDWLKENFADEWKPDWSEAQFLHHARRYPIGPFKRDWWDATAVHADIRADVRNRAATYFTALNVADTKMLVANTIVHTPTAWCGPDVTKERGGDEALIRDLAD